MSRIIEVEKAIDIVRNCCSDVSPTSKAMTLINQHLEDLARTVSEEIKIEPLQSGVAISPGPAIAKVVQEVIAGRIVLPVSSPFRNLKTKPLTLGELARITGDIRAIQTKLKTFNFCDELLACVARGFRQEILPSRTEKRNVYVTKAYASHFIPAGTTIPKGAKRQTRP